MHFTVWLFKLEQRGLNWNVQGYIRDVNRIPVITGSTILPISDDHKTISKIRKTFEENITYSCVVEYDITAPSDIYQMVIEYEHIVDKNKIVESLKKSRSIECIYHTNVEWIDNASKEYIKRLKEY